jgi:hypothetical protein
LCDDSESIEKSHVAQELLPTVPTEAEEDNGVMPSNVVEFAPRRKKG